MSQKMPKAYWIAHVTVTDPDSYSVYANGATEAFAKYGGRILARAGRVEALEGHSAPRNVAVEFDSFDAALQCYNSSEYQSAKRFRKSAGVTELIILEGVNTEPAILSGS